MKLSLSTISGSLALVGTIAGGVYSLESRYANANEINTKIVKLENRVKVNELKDTKNKILKRKYFLLEQLQALPNSTAVKRELESVENDLSDVSSQIKDLRKTSGEEKN